MSIRLGLGVLALCALFTLASCGSGRVLESITVDSVSSLDGTTYTATGHFNTSPMTVKGLQVAWFQTGLVVDPVPNWSYTLSTAGYKEQCFGGPGKFYVVAYAPQNPNAPANGSMPFQVFSTLVEQRKVTQLDGYVAGSLALSCPTV